MTVEIPLYLSGNAHGAMHVALVDEEDEIRVRQFTWHALWQRGELYACANVKSIQRHEFLWMHRFVVNAPIGTRVYHRGWNKLDNRRENLLVGTRPPRPPRPLQLPQVGVSMLLANNTSGYRGVCLHRASGKWKAALMVGGKLKYLGLFETPELASAAYWDAVRLWEI